MLRGSVENRKETVGLTTFNAYVHILLDSCIVSRFIHMLKKLLSYLFFLKAYDAINSQVHTCIYFSKKHIR